MNRETTRTERVTSQNRRKVDPTHIGDLGEYKIDVQLRQFPKENRYINDLLLVNPKSRTGYSQIDHTLITPYGLFVIETKNWYGKLEGGRKDSTWTINGRFKKRNPLWQNYGHIKALEGILKEYKDIKFVSMISFTTRCELYIDSELRQVESDELVVYDIMLTEFIERKLHKFKREMPTPPLSEADVISIYELVNSKNITDPKIRAEHIRKASKPKETK